MSPQSIRALNPERLLEIVWQDNQVSRIPYHTIRCACPCAMCVNELTGERVLDPAKIPADIHPTGLGYSGNYALKIGWSDGHHSGLFSWELLARTAAAMR